MKYQKTEKKKRAKKLEMKRGAKIILIKMILGKRDNKMIEVMKLK